MKKKPVITRWIVVSLFTAILATILPFPHWISVLQPQWALMVVLFWVIRMPEKCGVGIAWLVGLFVDSVTGTLMGMHAFVFALIAYIAMKWPAPLDRLPTWQQIVVIGIFSSICVVLQDFIMGIVGEGVPSRMIWFSVFITAFCWPLITSALKRAEIPRIL